MKYGCKLVATIPISDSLRIDGILRIHNNLIEEGKK